jgi:YidC/Oxa1 family membrane protein insertase
VTHVAAPAAASGRPRGSRGNAIMFAIIGLVGILFLILGPGQTFDTFLITPLINLLVFLDILFFGNFGLAIIVFTVLLRLATMPFTIRQLESTRAMQAAQPQMQEIQKKYKDPKRRQEEMMKLYKEVGFNPLGCAMPLIIQMGVFFALYRALRFVVGGSPESLVGLSQHLYNISALQDAIPLDQHFLWLNLGQPDVTYILPLLVAATTYVQQKMSATPTANPQTQQQQQMMAWMLPLMLFFLTVNLPSGVGLYWVTSNVFQIFAGYYVYGRRALSWRQLFSFEPAAAPGADASKKRQQPQPAQKKSPGGADGAEPDRVDISEGEEPAGMTPAGRERPRHGKRRGKRKNRR